MFKREQMYQAPYNQEQSQIEQKISVLILYKNNTEEENVLN